MLLLALPLPILCQLGWQVYLRSWKIWRHKVYVVIRIFFHYSHSAHKYCPILPSTLLGLSMTDHLPGAKDPT
uniref:Secreted protein n=1 Tax=Arundo donax TaxID=35708 RepID=A0A0A9B3Q1_ARUDO